jgi:hypothetical protein
MQARRTDRPLIVESRKLTAESCLSAWGIQFCIFDAAILPIPTPTIFSRASFFVCDGRHYSLFLRPSFGLAEC